MAKENKKYTLGRLYYWLVGHRSRPTYWTCGKFAAWIRSKTDVTKKPRSATTEGWNNWHKENKDKIGYWIAEEGLDILQDIWMFLPDVYNRIRIYIRNRYIDKTHYLNTKLKKGEYHDFQERLLHGMFEALVDFVEDEKAALKRWSDDEKFKLPNAEKGIEYLEWEMTLTDEDPDDPTRLSKSRQAEKACETLTLYRWWKEVRPHRKEPEEIVGLWAFYDKHRKDDGENIFNLLGKNLSPELEEERKRLFDESIKVETEQYNEDTEMMIRLVKLRDALWT